MKTKQFLVPNISCGHCVHTIQMELVQLEGVEQVIASQETKNVQVEFHAPATEEQIIDLLTEIHYPPQ